MRGSKGDEDLPAMVASPSTIVALLGQGVSCWCMLAVPTLLLA